MSEKFITTLPVAPDGHNRPSAAPKRHIPWMATVVILASIAIIGLIALKAVHQAGHAIGKFIHPKNKITEVISASVESLHRKAELVVAQMHITATVSLKQSTYWAYIYWGTTDADVTAVGNRVQFIDQFSALTPNDFTYDSSTNTLTCIFPQPIVDTGLVQVQTNPSKIIVHGANGWALFNAGTVERKAKSELRAAIIMQAQKKFLAPLVRAKARQTLKNVLELVVRPLNPTLHLHVRFAGERGQHE